MFGCVCFGEGVWVCVFWGGVWVCVFGYVCVVTVAWCVVVVFVVVVVAFRTNTCMVSSHRITIIIVALCPHTPPHLHTHTPPPPKKTNTKALEYAKTAGALCMGITNTVGSALSRNTHFGVHINAGAEIGVASTKAYTSQIVVLTMVALAISEDSISKRARRDDIIEGLRGLPDAIRKTLALDKEIQALAEELKEEENLLLFGRGYNYATALEGALKVKEVALMHRCVFWGVVMWKCVWK